MNYKLVTVLTIVAIILIVVLFFRYKDFPALFSRKKLEKVEIKFGYDSVQTTTINDRITLDKYDSAIMSMIRTDKFHGGLQDTSATFIISKDNTKVNVLVSHSPYYGWSVGVNGREYDSQFLFDVVRSLLPSR